MLSDHGFRAEYRGFAVNKWLREQGLLHLKRGRGQAINLVARVVQQLNLHTLAKTALQRLRGKVWQQAVWATVDWSRTKVVYGPGPAFYVNLKDRDAEGIVTPSEYEGLREQIIAEFKAVRDPATGLPIAAEVHRREEIYQGEAVDLAPDLVPVPAEYVTNGSRWGYGFGPMMAAVQSFRSNLRYAGAHSPEGILIAHGPGIAPGRVSGLHIADLAPTSLYALGLDVPQAMDGQVRTELFEPAYVTQAPARYVKMDLHSDGQAGQVMSEKEEALVESRLRDLGYL